MNYKLDLTTVTEHYVFSFKKTRYAKTIDEIVDYVNEMVEIFKKSAKVIIAVSDGSKLIAQYHWDFGWRVF